MSVAASTAAAVTPINLIKRVWERIAPLQLAERSWDNVSWLCFGLIALDAHGPLIYRLDR